MLVALLLTTLLAGSAAGAQAAQLPTQAEAEEMARQGKPEAALDAFRKRASANPNDLEARIWIARLHEQMGHPELAEPVYRSVMLESTDNVDAMLGAGRTLVTLDRGDEALLVLDRAAKLAPKNAAVLAALGRAHVQVANIRLGLSYLELANSIDASPENREALEQARRAHGHRIAASGIYEHFNVVTANTGSGNLVVDYRLLDRLRVMARGQFQRKFGFSDQRAGVGLEWRWHPQVTLTLQGLAGPGNDILPKADALIQVAQHARHAGWSLGYRYVDFGPANVSVFSPGVQWSGDAASLGITYSLAVTNADVLLDSEDGHSVSIDGSYRLQPRLWLRLGYAYGVEDFDTLSPDRLGRFKANTARGGFRIDLATVTTFSALYEYQNREDDVTMNRVSATLTQGF
jgi:YaiO family outer membrane protein